MSKVGNNEELKQQRSDDLENEKRNLTYSFLEEMNTIKKQHRRMVGSIKEISFKKYNQKEIGNIIDEIVFEFEKLDNERIVKQVERGDK